MLRWVWLHSSPRTPRWHREEPRPVLGSIPRSSNHGSGTLRSHSPLRHPPPALPSSDSRLPGALVTVLHVLPSLDAGGAERLVVELVTGARERGIDARIAVLAPARADSPVLADSTERGLPVTVLGR